jgi:hypothetical protein
VRRSAPAGQSALLVSPITYVTAIVGEDVGEDVGATVDLQIRPKMQLPSYRAMIAGLCKSGSMQQTRANTLPTRREGAQRSLECACVKRQVARHICQNGAKRAKHESAK